MPLSPPRPRQTQGQAAYSEIRRQILHGELSPGEFVCERQLAERLDAGKAAVRLAVQRLAGEAFVTIQPRRGITVASQSLQDIIELCELRLLLEQRVVRSIAGRLTPKQIRELHRAVGKIEAAMKAGQAATAVERDFAFHRLMCEFQGNRQVAGVLDRIYDGLFREATTTMAKILPAMLDDVRLKHERIIEAIERGDADGAERQIEEHLRLGEQFIMSRRTSL